ncbi:MAG: biotin/lipoyl-binding protein [Chloroflexi bacterium]|nr:biotin/lipoyl-binding protein [Chloroflexota bacterium]MCH7655378.1 biotin/lipoyl-binding protein [Chloroflexota bacterium]
MKQLRVRINGEWYTVEVGDVYQSPVEVVVDGETYLVELDTAVESGSTRTRGRQQRKVEQPGLRGITEGDDRVIRCPLPGKVVSVAVSKGQVLEAGDEICQLESMKMEQSVRMATGGTVKNVKIKKDQSVNAGTPLIELQ